MMFAHVGGLPLEETLATGGPALLTALGALTAQLRARRIRSRSRSRARRPDRGGADRGAADRSRP
jgi:hypothetical protein